MSAWLTTWLLGAVAPFLTAALQNFVKEWLRNKALADGGARQERAAQDASDAAIAAKAKEMSDEVRGLSDADFAARAGRWS